MEGRMFILIDVATAYVYDVVDLLGSAELQPDSHTPLSYMGMIAKIIIMTLDAVASTANMKTQPNTQTDR